MSDKTLRKEQFKNIETLNENSLFKDLTIGQLFTVAQLKEYKKGLEKDAPWRLLIDHRKEKAAEIGQKSFMQNFF